MRRANPRLSRVLLASALAAFAATGAAAADKFLKLHDVAGENPAAAGHRGEQIEVHSIQWGSAPAAARTFKGEIATIEPTYKSSGGSKARSTTSTVDANEKITIHGGRTESKLPGKRRPPTVTLKRGGNSAAAGRGLDIAQVDGETVSLGAAGSRGDPDRPIVAGTVPTQFNPKEYSISKSNKTAAAARATPLAKGSVWIRVSSPWAGCRVGARYPSLELGNGGRTYRLQDVTVASCGASGDADDRPTEEVAFYYNRIAFNYAQ